MENNKIFKTDNLSLAPYLLNQGLKFIETEMGVGKNNQKRILFIFADPKCIGKDLERAFLNSLEKRYKDSLHYFRNQLKICQDKNKEKK